VPEIVQNGISGYVCHSVSQLAKRVYNLHFNPGDLRCNTFNFSLDRMVANYASVYKDALAQRRI
jgi:hypothetical protein